MESLTNHMGLLRPRLVQKVDRESVKGSPVAVTATLRGQSYNLLNRVWQLCGPSGGSVPEANDSSSKTATGEVPPFLEGGPLPWPCGEPAWRFHWPGQDTSSQRMASLLMYAGGNVISGLCRLFLAVLPRFCYGGTSTDRVGQQEHQIPMKSNRGSCLLEIETTATDGTSTYVPRPFQTVHLRLKCQKCSRCRR